MALLVYPLNQETDCFIRFANQIRDYEKIIALLPEGEEKKSMHEISELDNFRIISFGELESSLSECKDVYINAQFMDEYKNAEKEIKEIIYHAQKYALKIYVDCMRKCFLRFQKYGDKITMLNEQNNDEPVGNNKIYEIPVPVIFLAGVGENTEKFLLQLSFHKELAKREYRFSQLGSRPMSKFFGFPCLPQFVFEENITMRERILRLNHYLYDLVRRDKSELLVIGVPGGLMQSNPYYFEDFGETMFLISNAVMPDTGVLCVYAEEYDESTMNDLKNICFYKGGFIPNTYHMSQIALINEPNQAVIKHLFIRDRKIMDKLLFANQTIKNINWSTFSAEHSIERTVTNLLEELSQNY